MKATTPLDVLGCRLAGINLIEASAGTGKTWAICGLVLRLLLERGLQVQRILVVTFTNAATAELRERIRGRIVETLARLRGQAAAADDGFVAPLLEALRGRGVDDALMTQRLELALQTFDEAAIFTIHGFCQRALADTPFAAHLPLALELVQDDAELVAEAANDFWRRHVAAPGLGVELAALLVARKDSPGSFARLLERRLAKPLSLERWPAQLAAPGAVDAVEFRAAHAAARALWQGERAAIVQTVIDALPALNKTSYKREAIAQAQRDWDDLLAGSDARAMLGTMPAKAALLGGKKLQPNKGHRAPAHPFFAAAQRLLELHATAQQTVQLQRLRLLRGLLDEGSHAVRAAKRARRLVAFDDMLYNLYERLRGDDADALLATLRARFPAALIDEFQDTDPLQFAIFDAVYRGGDAPLFLVGDPKQAIYSFRNADLPTYLRAAAQASAATTLADNQRAVRPLLDGLNALFGANDAAFMLDGLAYQRVGLGRKPRPVFDDRSLPAAQQRAALQVWSLPKDGASGQPLPKARAMQRAAEATAREIACLLGAARRGEVMLGGKRLDAGDIAVLVRSHAQGGRMRQELAALGVGSVELSHASVHASPDAAELEQVLAAVLEPAREPLLKAALATAMLGLDAAQIDALALDEAAMLDHVQRFAAWHDAWLAGGVGVMLRALMSQAQVAQRMLQRADGERRLTNLLHLAECLQQAAETHPAPDALLRWLQTQRRDGRGTDDATQLRLESDRNLVQIVTIHKAKGLEYPIVFCPFLWDGHATTQPGGSDGVEYHDDEGRNVVDFRKGFADDRDDTDVKRRMRLEAAAETLRLIYVALTRAVQRCVLVAGCYTTKTKNGGSPKESTRSLLNWLVAGQGTAPQDWLDAKATPEVGDIEAAWDALAQRHGPALAVAPLPTLPATPLDAAIAAPEAIAALAAPQHIAPAWWIGSYSALAHGARHEGAALDHDLRVAAVVASPAAPSVRLAPDDILRFPRGAAAGDCLHALFERIDFTAPAGWPEAVAATLQAHHATLPAADREAEALREPMLLRMLGDVLATPLPVGCAQPLVLAGLPRMRRLTELEFHLPAQRLRDAALNALLAELGLAVPRLAFGTLQGYLKGFIDLVAEHEGRYFVLDWKSNHLGDEAADYAAAPLAAAMAAQGYHLQALLYCVALHRLLRDRLPSYDPARHLGGAIYLFVRGVRRDWTDASGAPTGVHFQRPAPQAVERLSALLDRGAV